MRKRGVLLGVVLVLGGGLSAAQGLEVGFMLEMDGGIVLPVRINGSGPHAFRLDTGASRTVVTARLARRLGLEPGAARPVLTPAGRESRPRAEVDGIQLGCGGASGLTVVILPDDAVDPAGRVEGLIGQDVLAAFAYTIDYLHRRLVCHQETGGDGIGVPDAVRLPLRIDDGRARVLVPASGKGAPLELVPDTGADRLVFIRRRGVTLPEVTPLDLVLLRSVTGHRLVRRVLVEGLDVGGARLGDREGLLMDERPGDEALGDGLLPLHYFARVTMNGPAGFVVLEPHADHAAGR